MRCRCLSIIFAAVALLCQNVAAAETQVYFPSYSDTELTAIRAWEQTWAGTRIDRDNIDQVRQYLPGSLYQVMTSKREAGTSWFTIVPYQPVPITPGTVALSRTHAGQPQVGPGGELRNYIAGTPFPQPKTGVEMAHNFRNRTYGDEHSKHSEGYIIDGKLSYDMELAFDDKFAFLACRTDHPPVPEFPNNNRKLWRGLISHRLKPSEERNMIFLQLAYKDRMRDYDSWVWKPNIRRIIRYSQHEKEDSTGGKDYCRYDVMGWDGPIQINSYTYLGQQDLLMARHNDADRLEHSSGKCLWSGVQRERVRVHVVELTNRDPQFVYGRMVWYLDPETWEMLYSERYNRQGQLWRVLDQICAEVTGYGGVRFGHNVASQFFDVQSVHSCLFKSESNFDVNMRPTMFHQRYLQKHGY